MENNMKHYIDKATNEVYAYATDGTQDSYIKDGLVLLTDTALATARAENDRREDEKAQEKFDALTYAEKRKAKYDLLNQDEMRYDDVKNSTTTWVDAIDAIKAEFPKP